MRAASKDKWLEVHGIEHWTHFYTDYGRKLQLRSSTISCTARTTAGTSSRGAAAGAPHRQVRGARRERMAAQAHEMDQALPRSRERRAHARSARPQRRRSDFDAMGDGVTFLTRAARAGDRDHRAVGAKLFVSSSTSDADLFVVLRVFTGDLQGGGVPGRDRSAHADRPGLAARLAPQARQEAVHALSALPHATTRSSRSSTARWSSSTSKSGRPRSWCRRATASASPSAARTTSMAARAAASCRTSRTSSRAAARSCTTTRATGPPDMFGGVTACTSARDKQPYLLLPVIPPKKAAAQRRGTPQLERNPIGYARSARKTGSYFSHTAPAPSASDGSILRPSGEVSDRPIVR